LIINNSVYVYKCIIFTITEATGNFTGISVLEYNFDLIRTAMYTTSEKLSLTFQTNLDLGDKQVVLAVVMSSK